MHDRYDPRVTIGIPTYNRADDYLKQTLSIALKQTYQNLEIIIADNCSTDNTEDFVNRISDAGHPFRFQPLKSNGPVIIGNEAWVGVNSVILSGVPIGEGAVVCAGSVVNKDVPDGAIAVGNSV